MRISTIAYIFKQGFKNIWRNLRFSLASISTMAACIFLFGLFLALVMNFNHIVHSAEEGIAILVYFDEGITQDQIDEIGRELEDRPEVAEIDYISADEAWEAYSKVYLGEDNAELAEGFMQDNPLANSSRYDVYLDNVEGQEELVSFAESLDGVRKVEQSEAAADVLSTFNRLIGYVSIAIVVILLAVAFFLIRNTITMGISVRQEEIGIMKLIGATNLFVRAPFLIEGIIKLIGATDFFVRSPFVIEGILLGAIGAAIPICILYFLYERIITYVIERFQNLGSFLQFLPVADVFQYLVPIGLGLGIGIGFIGSIFSVRKHLRV